MFFVKMAESAKQITPKHYDEDTHTNLQRRHLHNCRQDPRTGTAGMNRGRMAQDAERRHDTPSEHIGDSELRKLFIPGESKNTTQERSLPEKRRMA